VVWLNQRFSQPSPKLYVMSFYMIIIRGCAMCWWKISNACSLCMRELPHTDFCSCLYSNKKRKTKVKINMGSADLNIGEPKSFYYHYYYYYYCYNYYFFIYSLPYINIIIFILFYFICSPNFFKHYSGKAKINMQ
jgi:hypothetical protein